MRVRIVIFGLFVLATGCLDKKKKPTPSSSTPTPTSMSTSTSTSTSGGTIAWPVGTWRGQGTYTVVATADRSSLPVRLDINTPGSDAGGAGFVLSFAPYSATLAPDPTRPNLLMGDARYEALDDAIGKATLIISQPGKAQLLLQYPISKGFGAFSLEADLTFAP